MPTALNSPGVQEGCMDKYAISSIYDRGKISADLTSTRNIGKRSAWPTNSHVIKYANEY